MASRPRADGLEVATGQVLARHTRRRWRVEFLALMNRLVAAYPDRELHVILDNLNTHKPKHDRWLARHPQVHFHFTPTHASWLNLIEIWFRILARAALRGASFTAIRQLREAVDRFIALAERIGRLGEVVRARTSTNASLRYAPATF